MNKTRQAADRAWQGTRKNLLINGNFDIWQRGTSTSSTGYRADRWRLVANGTPTLTTSRQDFTLGQTDVPGEPKHFVRVTGSQTGGTYCAFQQPMEDIRVTAGQTVTFSFWAKASASKDINAEFSQHFGTGGSPSAQNAISSDDWTLTTSWQKFSYTATMYSLSGKTIGTNDDSRLNVNIYYPLNDSFTIDIAQAQLEFGEHATEFDVRSFGEEYALCQRFFCKSYDHDDIPGTATGVGPVTSMATSTGDGVWRFTFPVTMRTAPTMTWYNPVTGSSTSSLRVSSGNHAVTNYQVGTSQGSCFNTTGGALANNGTGRIHCKAEAEF